MPPTHEGSSSMILDQEAVWPFHPLRDSISLATFSTAARVDVREAASIAGSVVVLTVGGTLMACRCWLGPSACPVWTATLIFARVVVGPFNCRFALWVCAPSETVSLRFFLCRSRLLSLTIRFYAAVLEALLELRGEPWPLLFRLEV